MHQKKIAIAHQIRQCANHYNGFNVSCVGWGQGKTFFGVNHKPRQDAEPICAEEYVMEEAAAEGVVLEGMVIVGLPRQEDEGVPTLHCCGERCRPSMRRRIKKSISVRPDTQLICINAADGVQQHFTIQSLHEEHGESLDD